MTQRLIRVGLAGFVGLLALASAVTAPVPQPQTGCPSSATVEAAASSVVSVTATEGGRSQTATGFVIGAERVLTAAHAVTSAGDVRVVVPASAQFLAARVLTLDSRRDLAILEVPGLRRGSLQPAGRSAAVASCAAVLAVRDGHVVALLAAVRRSVLVSIDAPVKAQRTALELAVGIRRGDSGAPVLDVSGLVDGLVFAVSREGPPTGWAVDASELRGLVGTSRFG